MWYCGTTGFCWQMFLILTSCGEIEIYIHTHVIMHGEVLLYNQSQVRGLLIKSWLKPFLRNMENYKLIFFSCSVGLRNDVFSLRRNNSK